MNSDFPRILTLLRKEKGITQKDAATSLEISQALLSHYEKGIRECGLDFLVKCSGYYGVSCDYLLGLSPDRSGTTITVEDIPDPEQMGKENTYRGSVLPTLSKKLIANSLNILFDLLQKCSNAALVTEVSAFLMLAVYRMFRVLYASYPKNQDSMFTVSGSLTQGYAGAAMEICEAKAAALANGEKIDDLTPLKDTSCFTMTSESLSATYPLFASSLFNLIQNSEQRIVGKNSLAKAKK
ncbi:MAG: helix-turn-helix domain-containing protein [Acetanaerobacterium sp.]